MDSNKIKIVATHKRFEQHAARCAPFFDDVRHAFVIGGEQYRAVLKKDRENNNKELWTYEDEKNGIYLVEGRSYPVGHNDIFERDNPWDMMLLRIAQDNGYVVKSINEVNPGDSFQRYYMEDTVAVAKESTKKMDRIADAAALVKSMTIADKREFAYFMRQPAHEMSDEVIDGYMADLVMNNSEIIITNMSKEVEQLYKVRAFIRKLVAFNLLTMKGEQYIQNDTMVAINENAMIAHVQSDRNRTWVEQMKNELRMRANKNTPPSTTVIDKQLENGNG